MRRLDAKFGGSHGPNQIGEVYTSKVETVETVVGIEGLEVLGGAALQIGLEGGENVADVAAGDLRGLDDVAEHRPDGAVGVEEEQDAGARELEAELGLQRGEEPAVLVDPLEHADAAVGLPEAAQRDVAGLELALGDAEERREDAEVAGRVRLRLGVGERIENGETGGDLKKKGENITIESSIDFLFSARRSSSSASAVRLVTSDGHSSKIWFST